MARCGCGAQTCGCRLVAGDNVTLTGAGTAREPWVVSAAGAGGGGAGGWSPGDRKETYRGDTAAGWLDCNGQAVSRSTYAALFSAVGTRFGPGNGSTTFNLPDETGRVSVGAGPGYAQDATGGTAQTVLSTVNLPPHTHTIDHTHATGSTSSAGAHQHNIGRGNDAVSGLYFARSNVASYIDDSGVQGAGAHTHTVTVPTYTGTSGSTGSSTPFTNLPPYRAMRVLIKT